jgi:hypothetical protein
MVILALCIIAADSALRLLAEQTALSLYQRAGANFSMAPACSVARWGHRHLLRCPSHLGRGASHMGNSQPSASALTTAP